MTWTFSLFLVGVTLLTTGYFVWFVYGALKHDWRWVTEEGCNRYIGIANTLIVSSGIAAALLATVGEKAPKWMLERAIALLVAAIILAVFFMLVLAQATDVAISRFVEEAAQAPSTRHGKLGSVELVVILVTAWSAVMAFLWGFLYVGRLALSR